MHGWIILFLSWILHAYVHLLSIGYFIPRRGLSQKEAFVFCVTHVPPPALPVCVQHSALRQINEYTAVSGSRESLSDEGFHAVIRLAK